MSVALVAAIASAAASAEERGAWFREARFGMFIHWGLYSVPAKGEWIYARHPWKKGEYEALAKTWNPTNYNPREWARLAKRAGMKYAVFTTRHHDGFCMFDSKQTDYSSTGSECPAKTDFTRGVVEAFRAAGFWTGLYFSKPDWHNDDYWAHEWATPDRNVNYSIADHPERWQRYCDFTYNQIRELTHNYGKIDILWLDGGWVRPAWSVNDETRPWLGCSGQVQELDMRRLAGIARERNPQTIIVDRSVGGRYENYRTPEKQVPDTLLPYPWETCMTMGDSWSYVPGDNYKSVKELIHMLCDVVAKGGNLLLNVGPDADGNLPAEALQRMEAIGLWLQKNGHAIYCTRPLSPYCEGRVRYTQSKDGRHQYAITLTDEAPYATVKELKGKARK